MAGFDNDVVFAQVGCDIGAHPNTSGAESSVEFTKAGGTVTQIVQNLSNTGASQATQNIKVAGTSADDPWTQWTIGSTRNYVMGPDNSASDSLKMTTAASATGSPSAGTTVWNMTSDGLRTIPTQTAFLAKKTVAQDNVTGNAATVQVDYTSVITNVGSDYDGTNTYTAPVSGTYQFFASIAFGDLDATSTGGLLNIGTSNRGYDSFLMNFAAVRTTTARFWPSASVIADMDAGDIGVVTTSVTGMAGNTVDLTATPVGANNPTWFSGCLLY